MLTFLSDEMRQVTAHVIFLVSLTFGIKNYTNFVWSFCGCLHLHITNKPCAWANKETDVCIYTHMCVIDCVKPLCVHLCASSSSGF